MPRNNYSSVRGAIGCSLLALLSSATGLSSIRAEDQISVALQNAKDLVVFQRNGAPLQPHTVLATSNPARGAGHEGSMLLWLDKGRPAVAVSIFEWQGRIVHEIDALARNGRLTGESRLGQRWEPVESEVAYQTVPDEDPPSEQAARRRLQLKKIAGKFSVTMLGFNDDNSDRERLRMLPSPVYQYQLDASSPSNADLIDGAVFAFVQGTDPEALLIIEAMQNGETKQWEYALVRSTAGALEGRLRGAVVFTARKFPPDVDRHRPHFAIRHSVHAAAETSP